MDSVPSVAPTFLMQREVAGLLRLSERTLEDWRLTSQGPPYLKLALKVFLCRGTRPRDIGDCLGDKIKLHCAR